MARRLEAGIGVAPGNVTPGPGASRAGPAARIEVGTARLEGGVIQPAGLAYLQPGVPDCLILNEITEEA
ncbi:hypothetical protein G7085_06875 [Tessaracoccus sp. HDW20]|uniref:hypothetical protein n=1 Tax=Tessaracoccus coleopterorum TaxID=2714950 RepID=UPI0018D2845C|nr:hypothetical protein [Tessaracoccus coleopterorum]NHB84419.1 hypothetical protein [Tessaracoccus coleopterorum]